MELKDLPVDILLSLGNNISNFCSTVYVKKKPVDLFNRLNNIKNFDFGQYSFKYEPVNLIENDGWQLDFIKLSKVPAQSEYEVLEGTFFILEDKQKEVYYVFSQNRTGYLSKVVHIFMQNYFYPNISRAYLTSKEIYGILEDFEKIIGQKILARNSTGKVVFGSRPESILRWSKGEKLLNFREHFKKARRDNMWVSWIFMESTTPTNNRFKFSMSRTGNLKLIVGDFTYFFKLLQLITSRSLSKAEILNNRELKKYSNPEPILLKYDLEVLENSENKKKLIEQLSRYPHSSYSVIHGGNPHIYMYIVDRLDRSVISFRTVGSDTIIITPQIRCNYASLMRFVNYLVEKFSEFREMNQIV